MNNDYNNFDRNKENEPLSGEVKNTPETPSDESPVQENLNKGPSESQSGNGEYHYSGSQMGDYSRDDTAELRRRDEQQGQSGSYTYHGSYGQGGAKPPYGDQAGPGFSQYNQNNQNNQYNQNNQNNGGYRPDGGQGAPGGWNGSPYQPYGAPPFTPPPAEKKKRHRDKRGMSGAVVAVTMIVGIMLSAAAGFGGAYVYDNYASDGSGVSAVGGNDGAVIHRVVESEESTSAGVKGVYTDVAATVKDSVVEITTEFQVTGFFQYVSEGAGSGVIISEDGYIITNNHVISDTDNGGVADTITVRLTNGNEYEASVVGKDSDSDIAVIKIEPDETLTFAVFGDSDTLTVGEEVIAVGNPLGELGGTVTNGIISALDREINVDGTNMNLLQTNAAINPGNSGGGLFNMKGELIGVVNAKSSGSGIEGLGFAIPSNDAMTVAEQLMENGYVTGKVFLGVTFYDVTDAYTAYRYFRSQATGVYVAELVEGYNDQVLKYGDRIVAIDGSEITEFSQIKDILKEHSVGDTLKFTIHREGKLAEVDVTCYEYVPEDVDVDFGEEG